MIPSPFATTNEDILLREARLPIPGGPGCPAPCAICLVEYAGQDVGIAPAVPGDVFHRCASCIERAVFPRLAWTPGTDHRGSATETGHVATFGIEVRTYHDMDCVVWIVWAEEGPLLRKSGAVYLADIAPEDRHGPERDWIGLVGMAKQAALVCVARVGGGR